MGSGVVRIGIATFCGQSPDPFGDVGILAWVGQYTDWCNHVEMRKILVKGVNFDNLTQEDLNLILSHVNSYPRMELDGLSAFEMFRFAYGEEYVKSANELGLKDIPVDRINLTPALIPDIARQVIEKTKRIGDEEKVARKAVEEYRRTRGE